MSLPPLAQWIFSLKTFLAAMLALWIGFAEGFGYPYWAMMVVYILALPSTGAIRQKALYMVAGSVLGATMAVTSSALFADSERVQLISMALFAAGAGFLALRDRLPSYYFFLLAAVTCMLVGLPGLTTPDQAFSRAVERVQDVLVGSGCALLVDLLILPVLAGPVLLRQTDEWLAQLRRCCVAVLRGEDAREWRDQVLVQAPALDPLARQLRYEGSGHAWARSRVVLAIRASGMRLLPLLSSLLDLDRAQTSPAHAQARAELAEWLTATPTASAAAGRAWRRRWRRLEHDGELAQQASGRCLRRLCSSWMRLDALQRLLHQRRPRWVPLGAGRRPLPTSLNHADVGYAGRNAFAVLCFFAGLCTLWSAGSWPSSVAIGLLLGTVFLIVSGLADQPLTVLAHIARVLLTAFVVDVFYLTVVLPGITSFVTLAMVLLPVLIPLGFMLRRPGGLLYAILPMALIRLGNGGSTASVDNLISFAAGLALGLLGPTLLSLLFRQLPAGAPARRLRRTNRRELAVLTRRRHGHRQFLARAMDRLVLLQSRAPKSAEHDDPLRSELIELRAGIDLAVLARQSGDPALATLRDALGDWLLQAQRSAAPTRLREQLDHALSETATVPGRIQRLALLDLRLALFPATLTGPAR